jgi:hypothetical protein
MKIREIAEKINEHSQKYNVGNLQQIRKENKSLKKLHTRQIFSSSTIFDDDDYAFHDGGRTEIQYNIGFEENNLFRYGLAFSLETGQTLPDINIMYPKIRKYNCLLRSNPTLFLGYEFWAWVDGKRTKTEIIHEVDSSLVKPKAFIFFGKLIEIKNINYDEILVTFDKMLPIYKYIEEQKIKNTSNNDTFVFEKTNVSLPQSKKYTKVQTEIDIDIRHSKIQEKLVEKLYSKFGNDNVSLEHPINGNKIDVVVNNNEMIYFFEIKTALTARDCIRQALGQIIEYAYWPGQKNADKLFIVGENEIDKKTENYINFLKKQFRFDLEYLQIKL